MIEDQYGHINVHFCGDVINLTFKVKNPHKIILGEFRILPRRLSMTTQDVDNQYALEVETFRSMLVNIIKYAGQKPYNSKTKFIVLDGICNEFMNQNMYVPILQLDIYIDILMLIVYKIEQELGIELADNEYYKVFANLTDYCLAKYTVVILSDNKIKRDLIKPMYGFLN